MFNVYVFSRRNISQNIFLSSVIPQYTPLFMMQTIKYFQCRQSSILNTAKLRSTQKMSSSKSQLLIKPSLTLLLIWLLLCFPNIVRNPSRKLYHGYFLNIIYMVYSLASSLSKMFSPMVKLVLLQISLSDK